MVDSIREGIDRFEKVLIDTNVYCSMRVNVANIRSIATNA